MRSEYRSRYRSDSRQEETPRRRHRSLDARTDRHESNEYAALVTKERSRSKNGESSDYASWLSYDEDDGIGSDCSSAVESPLEYRPERSRSETKDLFTPSQH